MLEASATRILGTLRDTDRVLDVGAWACPFNRAQWVLDAEDYATRGFYRTFGGPPFQGPDSEWFTEETWVRRDICRHEPWPFADRFFDFAICSHTLEDIRDPLWVCGELQRVAKAGYIEVPSRLWETCRGHERPWMAGLSHHRWLIELREPECLVFMQKYGMIHERRCSLPPRFGRQLDEAGAYVQLWWTGAFRFEEREVHGVAAQELELERFAQSFLSRPIEARVDRTVAAVKSRLSRMPASIVRRLRQARRMAGSE
jgi:hypothetical protein